jgi:sensor domain CHASE-containing protein
MTLLVAIALLTVIVILNALAIGALHNELQALTRRHAMLVENVARVQQKLHDIAPDLR